MIFLRNEFYREKGKAKKALLLIEILRIMRITNPHDKKGVAILLPPGEGPGMRESPVTRLIRRVLARPAAPSGDTIHTCSVLP